MDRFYTSFALSAFCFLWPLGTYAKGEVVITGDFLGTTIEAMRTGHLDVKEYGLKQAILSRQLTAIIVSDPCAVLVCRRGCTTGDALEVTPDDCKALRDYAKDGLTVVITKIRSKCDAGETVEGEDIAMIQSSIDQLPTDAQEKAKSFAGAVLASAEPKPDQLRAYVQVFRASEESRISSLTVNTFTGSAPSQLSVYKTTSIEPSPLAAATARAIPSVGSVEIGGKPYPAAWLGDCFAIAPSSSKNATKEAKAAVTERYSKSYSRPGRD